MADESNRDDKSGAGRAEGKDASVPRSEGDSRIRRRRHSSGAVESYQSAVGSGNDAERMMPRRSGRTPRRLMLSIWLMIALNFTLLIIGSMLLLGREEPSVYPATQAQGISQSTYQQSINDAAHAGPERVSNLLQPLDFTNPLLLWKKFPQDPHPEDSWLKVVLWVSNDSYQKVYQPLEQSGEIAQTAADRPEVWVTLAPQVQQFCKGQQNNELHDVSYRLKQYLGLDPGRRYERFVEVWVRPDDVFRPCPDPETDDRYCNLSVDQRARPQVKNIEDYPEFLRQLARQSYQPDGRPWTRLGYTYDWARGERGVGASEYMLVPSAAFRVAGSYGTDEYCGRDD